MSGNNERLNEQVLNVVLSDKDSVEAKLKKLKYLVRLGADVNAKIYGKSVLSWVKKDGEVAPEIIEFLKEKGAKEVEISKEEAEELAQGFWYKNGKIKSVEEIKSLVRCGANLGAYRKNTSEQIWRVLSLKEMNEVLKILPKGYKIDGSVNLCRRELAELPDFSHVVVSGGFDCNYNKLTSLRGAPREVGESFWCSFNQLTTLEGAPSEVGGHFDCCNNQLTTLEGAPKKVHGGVYCVENELITLEGAPEVVMGDFKCYNNKLVDLKWAPKIVGGAFIANDNELVSLEGAPNEIKGSFDVSFNKLKSLEGGPEVVEGSFNCRHNNLVDLRGKPKKVGGEFDIEKEVLDKIRSKETKSLGDIWGRLLGGR